MSLIDRIKWIAIRRKKLKIYNSHAHWDTYIDVKTKIYGNNKFGKGTNIVESKIGRYTYTVNARISRTEIGAFCSIGSEVNIGGLGSHPTKWISTHPAFYSTLKQSGKAFAATDLFDELKPNVIGNDVWIGARVLILDGIRIGDGAIIAAGSVVTKDVPPYAIVGGVPAKIIRYRFSEQVIECLLNWKWWSLPDEEFSRLAKFFCHTTEWTVDLINNYMSIK